MGPDRKLRFRSALLVAAAGGVFVIATPACGGAIAARDERVEPEAASADAPAAQADAAPTADAEPSRPVDPADLVCRSLPGATPHRVEGRDCPASGCSSCDDETDCRPGEICMFFDTKGSSFVECRRREDKDTGGHPYTYDAGQLCTQDCECDPAFGDRCAEGRCSFR